MPWYLAHLSHSINILHTPILVIYTQLWPDTIFISYAMCILQDFDYELINALWNQYLTCYAHTDIGIVYHLLQMSQSSFNKHPLRLYSSFKIRALLRLLVFWHDYTSASEITLAIVPYYEVETWYRKPTIKIEAHMVIETWSPARIIC